MTQTICRMYASPETARAAAAELSEFRQLADAVHTVLAPAAEAVEDLVKTIMRLNVPRAHANVIAKAIQEDGLSMVAVHAPLFSAEVVEQSLDEHQPTTLVLPASEDDKFLWDEAAPFSSAFRLPLLFTSPSAFSDFWNLPVLKAANIAQKAGMETIRFFSKRPDLFSGLFSLRMLSDDPTPCSKFFGLPVLSDRAAPFSAFLKLPTQFARK